MNRSLSKFDTMKFGKYKGESIATIMANNPKYLEWCCQNIDSFQLDTEAEENLKISLSGC